MSGVPDLAAWLKPQVEARKAAAEAASSGHLCLWYEQVWVKGDPDGAVAAHIAANDPADVIARCEAELAILEEHRLVVADHGTPEQGQSRGGGYRVVHEHPTEKQIEMAPMMWHDVDCRACRVRFPCRTVRLVGSGYRGRPGYREEWAP